MFGRKKSDIERDPHYVSTECETYRYSKGKRSIYERKVKAKGNDEKSVSDAVDAVITNKRFGSNGSF